MSVTAGMVGRLQHTSPCRSRRGKVSPRAAKVRVTFTAVRTLRKLSNSSAIRSWTSRFGSFVTTPDRSRTKPVGSCSASSPRSALANRPAVSRPRMVCSSSSEIVPLRPSRRRPLGVPGS